MSRTGRPVCDDPSLHKVSVRFTENEYRQLKEYAETHNLTMTNALKVGLKLLYETSK